MDRTPRIAVENSTQLTKELANLIVEYRGSFATHIVSNNRGFAVLNDERKVVSWGHEDYGDDSKVSGDLTNVKAVFSNKYEFAALRKDGRIVTWGDRQ